MKAVLALIIIYVGTFFVAIQGASQNPVQASEQETDVQKNAVRANGIDPAKDADIRSLLELIGAHDSIVEVANNSAEQFREKAASSNNPRSQAYVDAYLASYNKTFDPDTVVEQLVVSYDKHFTGEEIKGLLQFYGSPLGQKTAAETPRIMKEIQAASRNASLQAAKDALQSLRAENRDGQASQRPFAARRRAQR